MWSMATGVSWQAEHAAAMGDFTSVVPCAWQGAATLQVATVPVQGCAVVQVQVVPAAQAVVTAPIFCEKATGTLLTVYGALTSTLHGFAALQMQGEAGVQIVAPWVPLIPSGSDAFTEEVAKPNP